jgi:AraC-like DNA-binding protein
VQPFQGAKKSVRSRLDGQVLLGNDRAVRLEPAPSLARFMEAPLGCFWPGDSFFYWCASPTLYGFSLWGRPGAADLEKLCAALLVELTPGAQPHRSLVDASLVEEVDPAAFEVLQRYVKQHREALSKRVTKLALVRPAGLVGAVVAGFYAVLDSPYPTQAFTEVGPALEWLEVEPSVGELISERRAALSGVSPLVGQLRAVFAALGPRSEVAEVAKQLSLSPRTLQRRLEALGTSFQKEHLTHRLRAAQQSLLETDQAITAISFDAGFSTPQHFSAAFRKFTGLTPTQFRSRKGT